MVLPVGHPASSRQVLPGLNPRVQKRSPTFASCVLSMATLSQTPGKPPREYWEIYLSWGQVELGRCHRLRQRWGQGAVLNARIGVLPTTLPFENTKAAAQYIKGTIVSQAGFPGIEVAFHSLWPEAPLLQSPLLSAEFDESGPDKKSERRNN
ncbi:hypothetical protein E1B28_003810 [Marasmius oreades]|uniref:Uncharacterized protein n=1 Tax=Marasmius oreades TaxID=181124 RepID=A0A9P7UX80_9AGAR|nr:uncharacterized protein E1B28_003810 [Marasmius oreades]KAG7096366.1 hypothetical protein E1B28_003810 [Marasmius oreades]